MTVSVGVSSYGDLKGVMQVMDDRPGLQLIGALNRVNADLGYTKAGGPQVTVNEAFRPKARQQKLLNAYLIYRANGTPYAALAASPLYTSNHGPNGDITKSIAADLGVTDPKEPSGNRALNAAEQAAWRAIEREYGFVSEGDFFSSPEPWHKEFRLTPATVVPVGTKIATLTLNASPEGDIMLVKAVNLTADKSLGDIRNRAFAIVAAPVSYHGTNFSGSVRWIRDATEYATLAQLGVKSMNSQNIWDLVKNRNYARVDW
jgi:hypothetical protein